MFVENCTADISERLTIEKTGKEKRRQRQRQKKASVTFDPMVGLEIQVVSQRLISYCTTHSKLVFLQ